MDRVKVSGKYKIVLVKKNGLIVKMKGKNLITSAGLALIASLVNEVGDKPKYMAFGASGTAVDLTQIALQGTEHIRTLGVVSVIAALYTITTTMVGPGVSVSVEEVGVFNAAVGPTMLSRFLTPQFDFGPGDGMTIVWTMEFA